MRIQEIRSGISHLSKRKVDETAPQNAFEWRELNSVLTPNDGADVVAPPDCDLDLPEWSVVSFDNLEAGGLKYRQAVELLSELDAHGIAGLCIITDEAASRTR